ncbi:MAG: GerAB/ArcD/ProY family transporter [Bacillota bacterium]
MNVENKIGHRETLTLLTIMMSAKVFLSFPRDMALLGTSAGWMIVVLAGVFSLSGFYFLYAINRRFPDDSIVVAAKKITGNLFGTFLGLLIFLFALTFASLSLRHFAESFILAVLPRTPISVITFFFLLILIYSALLGIETLTRTAWFFGPFIFFALLIILLFAVPQMNLSFLYPLLGNGPGPILASSVTHLSLFSEILLFGFIAPLIRQKEKRFGVGFYSLLLAIAINTVITFAVLVVFNYNAANRLIFPVFQLTRLIVFGEFIQRVEAIFVFLWFFTAGIQLGGLFYGAVISFAQAFNIKEHRPLVFPLAVLIFTLSMLPSSMTEAVDLHDMIMSPIYSGLTFGIPFLLWLAAIIFKKRAGEANG